MDGSAFARNIRALREKAGLTQTELGKQIGVSYVSIGGYETGRTKRPKEQYVIDNLKSFFNCTDQDLFGYNDGAYAKIHGLTAAPKGALAPASTQPAYAPLYGRVHAGALNDADILDGKVPIPHDVLKAHPDGFFLQVEGDCMDKVYPEGCYVFVDPRQSPQSGRIAVVDVEGECILRRLYFGASTVVLSPESHNAEWGDIVYVAGDWQTVKVVGTAVWFEGEL